MRSLHTGSVFAGTTFPSSSAAGEAPPAEQRETRGEKREWTISEMARDFGLTLRALRFYESKGLISPQRFGGARYYGVRDRTRLELVLSAKKMGFTLSETAEMIGRSENAELADLPLSPLAVESQIAFLENQKRAIDSALQTLRNRQGDLMRAAS